MDRVTGFRSTPQMPWINILVGKRPGEAMSGPGMLGRRCNRKEAEGKLQQSDEYLSLGQRLRYTGTSGWSVLRTEIFGSDETFLVCEYNRPRRRTGSPRSRMDAENVFGNAIQLRSERSPHRPEAKRPDPVDRDSISTCSAARTAQLKNFPIYIPPIDGKGKMNACATRKHARIWASSLPRFGETNVSL